MAWRKDPNCTFCDASGHYLLGGDGLCPCGSRVPEPAAGLPALGSGLSASDRFHGHLDACRQCREHPFGLCAIGDALLMATVGGGVS